VRGLVLDGCATDGVGGRGLAAVFDLGEAQVRSFSWFVTPSASGGGEKPGTRHLYLAPVFPPRIRQLVARFWSKRPPSRNVAARLPHDAPQ
jgi:hypothetical protein